MSSRGSGNAGPEPPAPDAVASSTGAPQAPTRSPAPSTSAGSRPDAACRMEPPSLTTSRDSRRLADHPATTRHGDAREAPAEGRRTARQRPERAQHLARTGKKPKHGPASRTSTEHPRTRGEDRDRDGHAPVKGGPPRTREEDLQQFPATDHGRGPPPHARGRRATGPRAAADRGTTRARAGKTRSGHTRASSCRDHPRTRGEDRTLSRRTSLDRGPPPHARGRPDPQPQDITRQGTTPARAGKTPGVESGRRTTVDHPRTRGEDRPTGAGNSGSRGPPPHARGRRHPGLL